MNTVLLPRTSRQVVHYQMQVLLQGIVEKWTDKHTERQWGKPATTAVSPSSSIGVWAISPSLGTFS